MGDAAWRRMKVVRRRKRVRTCENVRIVATVSIVAIDPQTEALGVAVQSKFLAVGALVPYARAGVAVWRRRPWRTRPTDRVDSS